MQLGEALVHRFSQILYRCFEEVGSTKAALYLIVPEDAELHLVTHFGWPRVAAPPESLSAEDPLVRWARRERRSFAVNQAAQATELAAFARGAESPRFLITPFYDRGDWKGLLIQRDRTKGVPYDLERDEAGTQSICEDLVQALRDFRAGREVAPPLRGVPESSAPTLAVPVPPSGAMVPVNAPAASNSGESLEGFHAAPGENTAFAPIPAGQTYISRNLDEPTDPRLVPSAVPQPAPPSQPGARFRAGIFLPEQRTFFWEAATLLCNLVPLAAVSLWMDEILEVRPILTYSRQPLSPELKQQVLAHVTYHVPKVVERDLRILTRVEYLEKEPLTGIFQTYLPVMLMGEGEGQDLLLLFRAEDRPFSDREQSYIQMLARMVGFHLQEIRLHERYHRAFLSVSHRLLSSVEGGAPKLRDHSLATAKLARSFALHLELPAAELEAVCIASILHDVGTFLLDPLLLAKPGLTTEERSRIQSHPVLATTFLKDFRFPFDVLGIIRHHHERWDGQGYPDGLRGEAIPLGSRIINLVESFEVMNDGSAFQEPRSHREILEELRAGSGKQFDPGLVIEFLEFLQTRRSRGDQD
jgi:response regulator RpfG family c-di-GMP phosphodiesterase